jgi:Laminin B (Domain IV)/Ig-like domain CHU_C associated/FG-GAP-like repeat/IPT/TIG domain
LVVIVVLGIGYWVLGIELTFIKTMRRHGVSLALLLLIGNIAFGQITSTFNTNDDGWTVYDNSGTTPQPVTYNASGGNPGGYVSSSLVTGQPHFWHAPAKFLGNLAYTSYGETISFDLQASDPNGHSGYGDIEIYNGSQRLVLDLVSIPAQAPGWTHYSIRLDESANWKLGSINSGAASKENILHVLTNVVNIRIHVQYRFAANQTGGLDNVVLNVHPPAPPAPVVASVNPLKAAPGATVTINGTGFGNGVADNTIFFGFAKGEVLTASPTQITARVPVGAEYGRVRVANSTTKLMGESNTNFAPLFVKYGGATLNPGSFDNDVQYNRTVLFQAHGDLNGDGKPELLLSDDGFISVFENTSTPGSIQANSFAARLDMSPSAAYQYSQIGAEDFDGDGKLDIFVAIRDSPDQGRIVVLRNIHASGPITAGSFAPSVDVTIPPYTTGTAHVADMDGDGRPDIISWGSSCAASPIYIMLNVSTLGDVKFTASKSYNGLYSCGARFATGDLDRDGLIDLIQGGDGGVRIMRNASTPGNLQFDTPFDFPEGQANLTVADLDNDQKPELIYVAGGLKVYKNISTAGSLTTGSFSPATIFSGAISYAKVADMNGDGKPDVITGMNGGVALFQNQTPDGQINSGTFRPPVAIDAAGGGASYIDVADFDVDGKPDIVSNVGRTANVAIIRNNASIPPTITGLSKKSAPAGSTITITGTDFGTALTDQVVTFGNARGTVTNATPTSLEVVVPVGASYDQILISARGYSLHSKDYFTPTFGGGSDFTAGAFVSSFDRTLNSLNAVLVHDFDDDGRIDVIGDNNSQAVLLRNVGTTGVIDANTFAANVVLGTDGRPSRKADFDGDGKLDMAFSSYATRNVSDPSLTVPVAFDAFIVREGSAPSVARLGNFRDMNNDSKVDIVLASTTANMSVIGNQARSGPFVGYSSALVTFAPHEDFARPSGGGGAAVADFDGDGFNDVVTTNPTTNDLSVFLNKKHVLPISSALFNAAVPLPAATAPTGIVVFDYDSDGKPDLAVTNAVNNSTASVSVFRNTSTIGTVSFQKQDFPAGLTPTEIAVEDMDGDGKVDIVVTNWGAGANSFSIFRNMSTTGVLDATSFAPRVDYATATSPRQLTIGDVDGDSRPDVIITRITANAITVFKNLMPLGPNISFTKQPSNAGACENGVATYTVIASGASNLTYQWQIFNTTTSLFENITANANYSGVTTSTLTVSAITAAMNGSIYRVRVNGDGAAEKFSGQATLTTSASPAPPTTSGATSCKGTSLTLTAAGSTDGNYRWFDNATTQQPISGAVNANFATPTIFTTTTFYAAIANQDGCYSTRVAAVATIAPITKPSITSNGTLLCGTNTIRLSGPAGFAAYNWSNGASTREIDVSFTGSYALIVEDVNGCPSLASDPIVISSGSVPKPVITAAKNSLCSETDQLTLSGPAGVTGAYEWSNGASTPTITVTTVGSYSLIVTDIAGCKSESSEDFVVTLGASKPVISVGNDVLVSTPAKTYQWFYGDFKIPDGTKQFLKFNPFQYGAYTVAVTDLSDCASTSDVFVNLVTEVEDQTSNALAFPSPFANLLVIGDAVDEAWMFDTAGRQLKTLVRGDNDVSELAKGLYLVRLKVGSEFKTIKVSK